MKRTTTALRFLRLAPRGNRRCSTTPSELTGAHEQVQGGEKDNALRWVMISGFNKFASRRDLQLVLGNAVPAKVETLLDAHSFFQGSWLVGFHAPDAELQIPDIRRRIHAQRDKTTSARTSSAQPPGEPGAPGNVSIRPVDYVPGAKNIQGIKGLKTSVQIQLASEQGITGATVRLRNVRYNVAMDAIKFFVREFNLGPKGIEKMAMDPRLNQYLIHFSKPSEAEKAMHALNLKVANGNVMHMVWYQAVW